jgi:RHS repeat-associated protein
LGSFAFDPGAGHRIVLNGSASGDVIADAVRLVGSVPAPANVLFIHADHLRTPQKMTDANRAIAWDRVRDPFGNTVSLDGAAALPLRFPGQYADEESGLDYNYFRDYDPTLGRYLQSDPIGLAGGLNSYGYVGGNPLRWVDPRGESTQTMGGAALIGTVGVAVGLATQCAIDTIGPGSGGAAGGWTAGDLGSSLGGLLPGWLYSEETSGENSAKDGDGKPTDPNATNSPSSSQGGTGKGAQTGEEATGIATEGATPGKIGKSKQFDKDGGVDQAQKDFDRIAGSNAVKDQGNGVRSTELPDGTTVSVRPHSTEGSPTIQITPTIGRDVKVRYH